MSEYKKHCESCGEKIAFPAEYIGYQINCPHCNALTLLTAPREAPPAPQPVAPAEPAAAAPVAAVPEVKESFWKRFKGIIELAGALIAIGGLGFGVYKYYSGPTTAEIEKEVQAAIEEQWKSSEEEVLQKATITEIYLAQASDNVFNGFLKVEFGDGSKLQPMLKVTVDPKTDELI